MESISMPRDALLMPPTDPCSGQHTRPTTYNFVLTPHPKGRRHTW
jgi:hypothetical protein